MQLMLREEEDTQICKWKYAFKDPYILTHIEAEKECSVMCL